MLEYKRIICLNTARIKEKKQAVCGFITEMNQVILFLLILNLFNTRKALQEGLMMVIKQLVKMKLKFLSP